MVAAKRARRRSGLRARKLGFTGAGVIVGDMAVGIDPGEPEMVRPDGQHVIAVYKDFTGEGTAAQGQEDLESYLDDSIIAAQGRFVYDLHDYTPYLPKGCRHPAPGRRPWYHHRRLQGATGTRT